MFHTTLVNPPPPPHIVQAVCNGKGTCGCNGRCECQEPYLGDYCEICSGDEICREETCVLHANCTQCAVNFFAQAPMSLTEVLTIDSLENFLPNGTSLEYDASTNTFRFRLSSDYCSTQELTCAQNIVVINGTDDVDYMIDSKYTQVALLDFIRYFDTS